MIEFRPLTFQDKSLISQYLRDYPPEISEFTFTNLFVWRNSRPIWYVEALDSLFFFIKGPVADPTRWILFGPPVGPASPLYITKLMEGKLIGLVRLPSSSLSPLAEAGIKNKFDRDNTDYVYRANDLAELHGRNYSKKRNLIKQCLHEHRCEYESIDNDNLAECRRMQELWCKNRSCSTEPGLCSENAALRETFDNYQRLNLTGGAIRVDGEIKAFAIGEQLNPTTAVCHFEKALPEIHGLAQLVNQWFAKFGLQKFEFINREQDLGIPGLRQAKESYYPHHLLEKFTVQLNGPLVSIPLAPDGCPSH